MNQLGDLIRFSSDSIILRMFAYKLSYVLVCVGIHLGSFKLPFSLGFVTSCYVIMNISIA